MKNIEIIFLAFIVFVSFGKMNAQNTKYQSLFGEKEITGQQFRFYCAFVHQHQNFFKKAFSFQELDAGVIVNQQLFIGAYYSTFVSNLEVKIENNPMFVSIAHGGLFLGSVRAESKIIHPGWLANIGYFSLNADDSKFGIFKSKNTQINKSGLILTPQLFAEINISTWMKFRTGITYSLYFFENQSIISRNDLQNVSVSFGFVFGKFN